LAKLKQNLLFNYTFNQSFHWFIIGLIFPVMILYIIDKGLNIFEAGVVMAGYSSAAIMLELPTGGLADSIGRKRVYLLSLAVMLAGATIFLFATGFASLLLGAIFLGVARALSSGSIEAWFIDEFMVQNPSGNLQRVMAKAGFFITLGIAFGSLLGGLIPLAFMGVDPGIPGWGRYSMNVIAYILLIAVQILLTVLLIRERMDGRRRGVIAGLRATPLTIATSVKFGIQNRITLALILATFAIGIAVGSVELLWQPRVQEILGPQEASWILGVLAAGYFASAAMGSLAGSPFCKAFKDNYGRALTVARIGLAVSLFLLALQAGLLFFALLYFAFYFILGIEGSPFSATYNAEVPGEVRSTMLSFQSLVAQLGGLLGTLVLGYVAQASSIATSWILAALVLLVSAMAYASLSRLQRKKASSAPSVLKACPGDQTDYSS
jgi:DHA1 family quinolone resistance protein-like MFS transporter